MTYLRYLSILLTSFLITGCGVYLKTPNISDIDFTADRNKSIIVGSVTQSNDGASTSFDDPVLFYFKRKGMTNGYRLESAEIVRPFNGLNRALADRGLEDEHGKLFAVQLQPGTYEIVSFAIQWPSQQKVGFSDPIEFELNPGEVVYLGNFDAQFCIRHAYANQYGVNGVIVSVTDRMARDEPLLKDRFIVLRQANITKKIISNMELQEQVGSLRNGCE